jgi:hypothetical protein
MPFAYDETAPQTTTVILTFSGRQGSPKRG